MSGKPLASRSSCAVHSPPPPLPPFLPLRSGGPARFINHCCEPNCYSKVITVAGEKHIVIVALRDLQRGEELTYNYKFAIETEAALKVTCYCGAKSCWGTMN